MSRALPLITMLFSTAALVLCGASPTWAALGEPADSIAADLQAMRGELKTAAGDSYSWHQITAPDGTVVREYVSPAGLVFGVAWQGPTHPNLELLLGSHFKELAGAAQSETRRHQPFALRSDDLVIEIGGHMRAFHGRAYLPRLLPDAVSASEVR